MPQVFFNSRHVGGIDEVEGMERKGELGDKVKECLEGGSDGEEFPPPLRTPRPEEYLQVRAHILTSCNNTSVKFSYGPELYLCSKEF